MSELHAVQETRGSKCVSIWEKQSGDCFVASAVSHRRSVSLYRSAGGRLPPLRRRYCNRLTVGADSIRPRKSQQHKKSTVRWNGAFCLFFYCAYLTRTARLRDEPEGGHSGCTFRCLREGKRPVGKGWFLQYSWQG